MLAAFVFNQTVTLASDPNFRGYFIAPVAKAKPDDETQVLIAISQPGATGQRGNVKFMLSDVRPVKVGK